MGIYQRDDSPYWWMLLERPGRKALRQSTGVLVDGGTEVQTKDNRRLAQAVYAAALGDVVRERHQLPAKRPAEVHTWGQWSEWYETHVISKLRGQEREKEILAQLRSVFAELPLDRVTREKASEYMTARLAGGAGARTVNREIDTLKSTMRVAAEHRKIDTSPLAGMPRLKVVKPRRRLVTPAEEARLLPCLGPVDRAIYLIATDSLVRLGDVLDLRKTDVKGGMVYVADPKDPQQSEPYRVPLSKRAREALKALPPSDGEYLFPSRRIAATERDRRHTIAQALRRACKRAGLKYGRKAGGITFHWATRRTGATRLIQTGVDVSTVQELGHWATADLVLEIYSEGSTAAAKQAVEVGGRLASKVKTKTPPPLTEQPTTHRWTSEEARAAAAKRKTRRAWTSETAPREGRPRTSHSRTAKNRQTR